MRVYISGKYSGKTKREVEENIALAENYASYLLDEGYIVFCPHLFHYIDRLCNRPKSFWLKQGKEWIRVCDAVFLLPGWEKVREQKESINWRKSWD